MALSLQDQRKVLAAGFRIFRLELLDKKIKVADSPGRWKTWANCGTKKLCNVNWKFLMSNDKYISG